MGLDASVMCTCYREGKTTPCPYPDYFQVDADGFPALEADFAGQQPDAQEVFDDWLAACCPHPNMEYAAVYIPSWKMYTAFREALAQREEFSTLREALPASQQGQTPAASAAAALAGLERFQRSGGVQQPFLMNSETGEPLGDLFAGAQGLVSWNPRGGLQMGVDDNGFYIRDTWELNRELFRATRFEQRLLEAGGLDKEQPVEYHDLDTGRRYVCTTPVRVLVPDGFGQLHQVYPRALHVERRAVPAGYFNEVVEPLAAIFRAALETGNPVRWS